MTTTDVSEIMATIVTPEGRPALKTRAERYATGKALRGKLPHSQHAAFSPAADRPSPLSLLEQSNRSRLAELVPVRYGRMALSPFTFLRGAVEVMAWDLATTPTTGIRVQLCGDAHLHNFAVYTTPQGEHVFDINAFDETLPGPWEWDVKRLAASVLVAGREHGYSAPENRQAVLAAVHGYQYMMQQFATMRYMDIWYTKMELDYIRMQAARKRRKRIGKTSIFQPSQRGILHAFPKLTGIVDGRYRISDHAPLIVHYQRSEDAAKMRAFAESAIAALPEHSHALRQCYHVVDIAQNVMGVGSVGSVCAILLCEGDSDVTDPLLLEVAEARAAALEPFAGTSSYRNHGQRVVNGLQLMQGTGDLFLSWGCFEGRDYYVRQLRETKWSLEMAQLDALTFAGYARACGTLLALGHARSGDAAQISGYLGSDVAFAQAVADFAGAYADQTARDYAKLIDAIQQGRIKARSDI
ncbi:MAG TPA: DUF2252 domain-containing protein [Ktedonobacteraceae bacterium]|jgi:uncharacterized protein (DUF2252 family)|nr:DUF2252 domain-containing protein [Ktedonobacteraceae bacterium]